MSQTDQDIETVRKAMQDAGWSPAGGAFPAFERIASELQRLKAEHGDCATDAAMADYPTGDDP